MKFILLFITLLFLGGCNTPPKIETCIHNDDGSAECHDPRKDEGEQDYHREPSELENYISTHPLDFNTLIEACKNWADD